MQITTTAPDAGPPDRSSRDDRAHDTSLDGGPGGGATPADIATAADRLARQLTALAASAEIGDHTAVAAAGTALAAADQLTSAVVALLGRTSDRGVIASEGVSVSTWLRVFARRTTADERMLTATVERLADLPTVHRWFSEGLLSWPAVRGIVAAVRNLTRDQRAWVDAAFAARGEALCRMDADRVVSAAERLADRARPDLHEAREQRAFTGRRLAIHPRLDGSSHVTAEFDAEGTATLLAGLAAAEDLDDLDDGTDGSADDAEDRDAPRSDAARSDRADAPRGAVVDEDDGRDARWRRRQRSNADRLIDIVSAHLSGRSGGRARPSAIVVTDIANLQTPADEDAGRGGAAEGAGAPTAQLLWNCHAGPVELTASAARRLTCDSTLRHVLVDDGVVLGATAAHPVVSATLRAALVVRDGGCRFPGCRAPVDQCDNHHLIHRADGGPTKLDNLMLLCNAHHHAVHDSGWATTLHTDGTLDFTRRGVTITSHPRTAHHLGAHDPPPTGRPRRRRRSATSPPVTTPVPAPPSSDPTPADRTPLPF